MAEEAAASVPEDDLVAPRTKKDQSSCDAECVALVVKVVIVVLFVWPLLHFALFRSSQEGVLQQDSVVEETLQSLQEGPLEGNKSAEVEVRRVLQEPQPTCPKSYMLRILAGMCQDLFLLHEQCTAADVDNLEKHKLPIRVTNTAKSNTTGEPRGTIVGCAAAGLLLTSLGAAVLELYRAKSGGDKTSNKAKPALSRKCSLADLTVLKHNRKELVRRESILEGPEPNNQPGYRVPPLYRRCSFPVGPTEGTHAFAHGAPLEYQRRISLMEPRRLSIIDSRRSSTTDCRKSSADPRRISVDGSPERRHWSRLVHRH